MGFLGDRFFFLYLKEMRSPSRGFQDDTSFCKFVICKKSFTYERISYFGGEDLNFLVLADIRPKLKCDKA